MSNTMQNPGARPELTEDHRPLADSELDAVTGGWFSGIFQKMIDQIILDYKDALRSY
jgi:hypothetical protein